MIVRSNQNVKASSLLFDHLELANNEASKATIIMIVTAILFIGMTPN